MKTKLLSLLAIIIATTSFSQTTFTVDGLDYEVISTNPNEVKIIGGTPATTTLNIPASVTDNSTTYSVTVIGFAAFGADFFTRGGNIPTINTLIIPNTVRAIEDYAFTSNEITGELIIPDSVITFGTSVFTDNQITSVTLPSTISVIPDRILSYNNLSSITIPDTVVSISDSAFRQNNLTSITIPNSVTSIDGRAFRDNSISDVIALGAIPPSFVLGQGSFNSFDNLGNIDLTVPIGSVNTYLEGGWIGFNSINGVFIGFEFDNNGLSYRVTSLVPAEVEVTGGTSIPTDLVLQEVVTFENIDFTLVNVGFRAFDAEGLDSVILPNTLRNIGDFAFENNGMPSVEIPEGVEIISFRSFRGNTLTTITIPSTVTSIAQDAFANNPLQTVTSLGTIPASIETLTFGDRSGIDLFIPEGTEQAYLDAGWIGFPSTNGVISIGFEFDNNGLLYRVTSELPAEVEVIGGTSIPTNLVLPDIIDIIDASGLRVYTLVSVGFRAFDAEGLDSVILPNTLRNIGDFAFENNGMPSVEIPEGVEIISFRSFRGNTLTTITIPSTVTSIAQDAFANNPLQTVTSLGTIPASIETLTFGDRSGIDLFIPEGTEQAYLDAGWTGFASVTEITIDITVAPKVFLQGASLNPIAGEENLMRDDLRVAGLIPAVSPYPDEATIPTNGGMDGITNPNPENDCVDWVFVELRDANDNTSIVASQSALLQRDGDVVAVDGSPLSFNASAGDYFVVIKHRNHLGVMTANTIALSSTTTTVDFTDANNPITFGSNAQTTFGMPTGVLGLWAGNINGDGIVQFSGATPDASAILSNVLNDVGNILTFSTFPIEGYTINDVDMNGSGQYEGGSADAPLILQNVLAHPDNSFLNFSTFQIVEQLPANAARMSKQNQFNNTLKTQIKF